MDGEVTVGMYAACVTAGVCSAGEVDAGGLCTWDGGDEDLPLNCVSWLGLDAFCSWVGGDLPTEAQWEHAFRGDHDGVTAGYWIYPWGASPDPSCALVVMNEGGVGCGTGSVQPPRSRAMTSFSLYDMAGNVAEWVYDRYGETFETCAGPCVNPTGPDAGDTRVVRGGAFDDIFGGSFRTAKRDAEAPATRSAAIGGRCVRGTW